MRTTVLFGVHAGGPLSRGLLALVLVLGPGAQALAGTQRGVAAPQGLDEAFGPRRVALVVGVDDYDDPDLESLQFAVADAHAIQDVLSDRGLGGFEVALLAGQVDHAAFETAWEEATRDLLPQDTFVLYFAGHGTLEALGGTKLYLLFSDAELEDPSGTALPLQDLENDLEKLPALQRVLIVDACFSAVLPSRERDYNKTLRGPPPPPPAWQVPNLDVRLFATRYYQPAREDESLGHGVYTYYLLEALSSIAGIADGDAGIGGDGDGLVDAIEAHLWARDETVAHTGGEQHPWIRITLGGHHAIYLTGDPLLRTEAERAIIYGLDALPGDTKLLVDGSARGAGSISAGSHRVEILSQGVRRYRGRVRLEPGGRLDVGQLVTGAKPPILLGIGGSIVTSHDISCPVLGQLVFWGWTARRGGGRLGLGIAASVGYGDVNDQGPFVMGDVMGRVSWAFGEDFAMGPSIGAGLLWRAPETGGQSGPIVAPGLHARLSSERVFLALDPALRFTSVEDGTGDEAGLVVLVDVAVAVTVGVRF